MKVGQTVIAIESHPSGVFKKGDIFKILGVKRTTCGCRHIIIDIGITPFNVDGRPILSIKCHTCGCTVTEKYPKIVWLSAHRFIVIDESGFKEVTFEQIKEPAFCCAN